MGLHASLEQHQDDMMKKVGHKFKGNYDDEANPIKDDGNEGVPGKWHSTKGRVAEGESERKQNALWAQITDYEKRAKATKNDIKKAHYTKMADELRVKLKTRDVSENAGSVATVVNPPAKNKSRVGSLFGGTYTQKKAK
jgi:hypothetical protein